MTQMDSRRCGDECTKFAPNLRPICARNITSYHLSTGSSAIGDFIVNDITSLSG
ncbi:hypothetical protein PAXRUDRAFT_834098 [Paxillus rubicundulus Ve08.2h10]|uniref:Uncharacterized protein n=1 Tax=Paxillus rubicundulus Ve08.2h10 TaxID=930991 RepID=A0A0D0D724_9AGAM|nr:hypothetical protein PAXRUDRAFT_834098 [Paxillus rubicundulus Ve08.2h10]